MVIDPTTFTDRPYVRADLKPAIAEYMADTYRGTFNEAVNALLQEGLAAHKRRLRVAEPDPTPPSEAA